MESECPMAQTVKNLLAMQKTWWAVVYGIAKSWTGLSDEHFHFIFLDGGPLPMPHKDTSFSCPACECR